MRFWPLEKFCNLLRMSLQDYVEWHTDNQYVARIIDVGSGKSGLQSKAKRILEICVHLGIFIEPEWVPRSRNFKPYH